MEFSAPIKIIGINPYVFVSKARAETLKKDWRRPMPVLVQVNGKPAKPWRINMMPKGGGAFYLYLHGVVRKESATKVGDRVKVRVQFDDAYRNGPMHAMPSWFRVALGKNKKAKAAWAALPPSRKKEVLRYFATLRSKEAQTRNLARAMDALLKDGTRFMARTWNKGK